MVVSLRDFFNISNSPLAPEFTLNPLYRWPLRWDVMLRLNKVYEAIHKPVMRIAEFPIVGDRIGLSQIPSLREPRNIESVFVTSMPVGLGHILKADESLTLSLS